MPIPILFPGQDYIAREYDERGREVFIYAYRSQRGEFFLVLVRLKMKSAISA